MASDLMCFFVPKKQKLSFVGSFPHEEVLPKLMLPKKAEIFSIKTREKVTSLKKRG